MRKKMIFLVVVLSAVCLRASDTESVWGSIDCSVNSDLEENLDKNNNENAIELVEEFETKKWYLKDETILDNWNKYYTEFLLINSGNKDLSSDKTLLCRYRKIGMQDSVNAKQGPSIVDALLPELITVVVLKLDKIQSIMRFGQTCKATQHLAGNEQIWQHLFFIRFGDVERPKHESYQQTHRRGERNNIKIIHLNFPKINRVQDQDVDIKDYSFATWDYSQNDGTEADLTNKCFCHATFIINDDSYYPLVRPNFTGSCMRMLRIIGKSNIVSPKFCNTDMAGAILQGDLWSPDFSGANLSNAIIETTGLRNARFDSKSKIENITLILVNDEIRPQIVNATKENLVEHSGAYWASEAQ